MELEFYDLYRKYFEHQAIHHPDLLHKPGKGKVFEMIDVEDALGAFRTGVQEKGFILRVIRYSYVLSAASGNGRKFYTGGFIVAKHHSNRKSGKDSFNQVMVDCERLTDELVEKMVADSKNGHPLFKYSLNTPENINVQPNIHTGDVGYSGYTCIFHAATFWRNCITAAGAPAWQDDGLTPKEL